MNPKAETVEEFQRRRKMLHLGMVKLARDDLDRLIAMQLQEIQVVGGLFRTCLNTIVL